MPATSTPEPSLFDLFGDIEEVTLPPSTPPQFYQPTEPAQPTEPNALEALQAQIDADLEASRQANPAPALKPARAASADFMKNSLCMSIELHRFGISKKLKDNEFQVDADKRMVNASKRILESKEYQAIVSLDGQIRAKFYELTVPCEFMKGGTGFVPYPLIDKAERAMEDFANQRRVLVDAFLAVYDQAAENARISLRGNYNPADYPPVAMVARGFVFTWNYFKFDRPAEGSVSREVYEKETRRAMERANEAATVIQEALRVSFSKLIGRMANCLGTDEETGKKKTFQESTVIKMNQFLETFQARNLTGDQDLAKLVEQAKSVLIGVEAKDLRTNDAIRAQVQSTMQEIADNVTQMVTLEAGPKTRKLRLEDDEDSASDASSEDSGQ